MPPRDHTLDEILELFELDNGVVFTHDKRRYAQGAWDMMSEESRTLLRIMDKEDLTNAVIGEERDIDGQIHRLLDGKWCVLEPEVDRFLTLLFDNIVCDGDD